MCLFACSYVHNKISIDVIGMEQKCPYNDDFKCKTSGVCIRSQYVCNGQINCNDGSDEENCGM